MPKETKRDARADGEAEQIFECYSDHFLASFRGDTMRVCLGQIIPADNDPFPDRPGRERPYGPLPVTDRVEQRAAITMTWTTARILHDMLGAAIKNFEELNGEIMDPAAPQFSTPRADA